MSEDTLCRIHVSLLCSIFQRVSCLLVVNIFSGEWADWEPQGERREEKELTVGKIRLIPMSQHDHC